MTGPPLTLHPAWPFVVALATGVIFGFLAVWVGQKPLFWVLGGAISGLVTSTLASGLANAMAVPYTAAEIRSHQMVAMMIAVAFLALVGFLLALSAQRQQ